MSTLVIVESPAKAKTIRQYLGKGYEVTASMGHIRDLPKSQLGVDVENNYTPRYINIKGKEKLIRELKAEAKGSDQVLLATDPDREGEAISWHLANLLGLDVTQKNRVEFNEITEQGIKNGMAGVRKVNMDMFDAQQARRILDRLVGYNLSPFLWKTVRRGLSGGRVQSVAARLVVERDREIAAFKPEEYWNIDALLAAGGKKFSARLFADIAGKKLEIKNAEQAQEITAALEGKEYEVKNLTKSTRKKTPAAPFITSTLQQEASRRLGFGATRTMRAAQILYEGVELKGREAMGLITYMRTDSLRLSDEAITGAKDYITKTFGEEYVYGKKREYKRKGAAAAQDAHEAIRPTDPALTPEEVEKSLTGDVAKLYRLIWSRFTASQMSDCKMDTVSVDIAAGNYLFRASGFVVTFDGFTALYEEATDEKKKKETALPPLEVGMALKLKELKAEQKFTQPPPSYTEATLIKALEEEGIGRPSTYAPIIDTIEKRGYVEKDKKTKKISSTPLGQAVNDLLVEQFPEIMDENFTAGMEATLDEIAKGKANWVETVDDFYSGFEKKLEKATEEMKGKKVKVPVEETDEICEKCGRNMVIKTSKYGKFLACPGFPDCKNTRRIVEKMPGTCPRDGGEIVVRTTKKGRVGYGCSHYPNCEFWSWDAPTEEICPTCGSTLFSGNKPRAKNAEDGNAKGGKRLYCQKEGCGYERPVEE